MRVTIHTILHRPDTPHDGSDAILRMELLEFLLELWYAVILGYPSNGPAFTALCLAGLGAMRAR